MRLFGQSPAGPLQPTLLACRCRQTMPAYYPKFSEGINMFHDKSERVRWRQKQCVDYSFLMAYSHGLADYYMQLEDDVTTVPGWLLAVSQFVQGQTKVSKADIHIGASTLSKNWQRTIAIVPVPGVDPSD